MAPVESGAKRTQPGRKAIVESVCTLAARLMMVKAIYAQRPAEDSGPYLFGKISNEIDFPNVGINGFQQCADGMRGEMMKREFAARYAETHDGTQIAKGGYAKE